LQRIREINPLEVKIETTMNTQQDTWKEFKTDADLFIDANVRLRSTSEKYLKEVLSENDNLIEIDEDEMPTITIDDDDYNGYGSEYLSMQSVVISSVSMSEDGTIYLNTEDDYGYEPDRISTDSLKAVVEAVHATIG
jgi:uncharacterized protein YjiK